MKLRIICKSKIHHAVVTAADLEYVGSVGIDESLMGLTGIVEGEQVSLWNINNGQRIETYAIPLPAGTGQGEGALQVPRCLRLAWLRCFVAMSACEDKRRLLQNIHGDFGHSATISEGSGLASELRAQGDFLSVAACEVRPEARKPVTHVHGP